MKIEPSPSLLLMLVFVTSAGLLTGEYGVCLAFIFFLLIGCTAHKYIEAIKEYNL